jgi:putative transposase
MVGGLDDWEKPASVQRRCSIARPGQEANGPEFVALALVEWAERKGIRLDFIEPGRPMQNGFIERFNGSFRRGVLDMHVFRNLTEVREHAELRLADYNREIPHESLGGPTPAEFRQQNDPAASGYGWH